MVRESFSAPRTGPTPEQLTEIRERMVSREHAPETAALNATSTESLARKLFIGGMQGIKDFALDIGRLGVYTIGGSIALLLIGDAYITGKLMKLVFGKGLLGASHLDEKFGKYFDIGREVWKGDKKKK